MCTHKSRTYWNVTTTRGHLEPQHSRHTARAINNYTGVQRLLLLRHHGWVIIKDYECVVWGGVLLTLSFFHFSPKSIEIQKKQEFSFFKFFEITTGVETTSTSTAFQLIKYISPFLFRTLGKVKPEEKKKKKGTLHWLVTSSFLVSCWPARIVLHLQV